ncbi:MAG: flagellar export protein FliJ [Burkholderiaceae bacterium]|jgi:flagellar FliJ protein|nr:flagellar export protein FliJ [Burkholderiaceae bacterium]
METHNLRMLIELAVTTRDAAAVRRAQAQTQVAQAQAQLDTLNGYARDYDRRAQTTLSGGCDIAVQSNLRAFADKLKRAVEQQTAELARRTQVLAAADAELLQMQRKLKSLEALAERKRESARLVAARREQKTMDEMAQHAPRLSPLAGGAW